MEFNLTNDLQFKMVMTDANNMELTQAFIEDMLHLNIKKATPVDPYNYVAYKKRFEELQKTDRLSVLYTQVDIKVELESGEMVIIEMQSYADSRFRKRMLYYITHNFSKGYKQEMGNHYDSLKPAYGIAILNKLNVTHPHLAKLTGRMIFEETGESVVDINSGVEDYIKQVEFYLKVPCDHPRLKMWQDFFLFGKIDANAPHYLKDAIQKIEQATQEEVNVMETIEILQKNADYLINDAKEQGMIKGLAKGEARGRVKERQSMLRSLIRKNLDDSFILDLDFTLSEISKVRAELNRWH